MTRLERWKEYNYCAGRWGGKFLAKSKETCSPPHAVDPDEQPHHHPPDQQHHRTTTSTATTPTQGAQEARHHRLKILSSATASSAALSLPPKAASPSVASSTLSSSRPANPRFPSPSRQPHYPAPIPTPSSSAAPQVRVSSPTRWSLRTALIGGPNPSPFKRGRSQTVNSAASNRTTRPSAARLWNPSNSTPRGIPLRQQQRAVRGRQERPYSPDDTRFPIAVPLEHPEISLPCAGAAAGGDYPLLTLPEKRRSLHSPSTRASLQIERSGSSSGTNRVSLPRSVSIDLHRRSGDVTPIEESKVDKGKGKAIEYEGFVEGGLFQIERKVTIRDKPESSTAQKQFTAGISVDRKGKGRTMTEERGTTLVEDLERGPQAGSYTAGGTSHLPNPHDASRTSLHSGIGSAMSDSTSIMGSDGPAADPGEEWGPQHPCYPHLNPHVPLSSPLYQSTRIIRIRRDWMIEGDLAPTFSNLYPEILEPAGVSEQDFRTIIERVNNELITAFSPYSFRNIVDGVVGLFTGWISDDLGLTGAKKRLRNVERYLDEWNREMEGKSRDGPGSAPQIVPLRRTGYMNLDFQVPDPEISYSAQQGDDRTNSSISRPSQ